MNCGLAENTASPQFLMRDRILMFAGDVDLAETAPIAWETRVQEGLLVLIASEMILSVLQ